MIFAVCTITILNFDAILILTFLISSKLITITNSFKISLRLQNLFCKKKRSSDAGSHYSLISRVVSNMHLYVQLFLGAKHDRDTWFLVMKRTAIKGLVQKRGQNEAILKVNLKLLLTSFMTSFFFFNSF